MNEEDPDGGGSRLLQHRRVIMLLEGGGPQPPTPSGRPPDDDAISLPDAFDLQMPEDDVAELFGNLDEDDNDNLDAAIDEGGLPYESPSTGEPVAARTPDAPQVWPI